MTKETRSTAARGAERRQADVRAPLATRYKGKLGILGRHEIPKDKVYRWVAEAVDHQPTPENVSERLSVGWRPVPADRHPKATGAVGLDGQMIISNVIRKGGQILMEMDRRAYERERAELRDDNVDIIKSTRWTGLDNFGEGTHARDFGSQVGFERTTSVRESGFDPPEDDGFLKE